MIFFLNYDGTLTRQDTGRIFQGSSAVPEIKVLSGVSNTSSVLQVAFTLPNGLVTQYFPLTQKGEYEQDGIKAFLWSLELATDILANVTEQVGKVGVSVRQVNVINNSVVASYTATFDVEYSALPYTPSEYTPADTQELIDLLGAYYNQNQTLIDSIKGDYESVVGRLGTAESDINTLESDVDKLEGLTDKPLLINITTDVETGVGTKYYNDGTTSTFEIGTDVATSHRGNFMTEISFLSTSLNWTQEQDGTYSIVFSPATTERKDANCIVAVDRLDGTGYNQTANGVLKGSDGSLALYGVATPFDGKLLVLAGGGAGTKIWTSFVRVGDEISGLSFDTASTPDVYNDFIFGGANSNLIKVGEVTSTIIQGGAEATTTTIKGLKAQNLNEPPQAELVWFNPTFNEVILNQDENKYFVDGVEYTLEEVSAMLADETIVYRDYEEVLQNNGKPTGWLVDGLTFDKKYTIEEVNNQAKWGDYIGANDKSTLFEALVGDYYLEEATGKLYLCVGKTDTSIEWEYLFTGKASLNINGTQTSQAMFFAPTTTREANRDGSCWVLTPNGQNAPEWGQMTLETADNLTYTIKVGGKNVGSFTLTKEVFLDSVSYNPETKKLTFTYNTESGKASIDIDLSDLEEVQNALIATNDTEFLAYQTAENVGKLVTYDNMLYTIYESTGGGITAKLVNEINSIICNGTTFFFSYKIGNDIIKQFQVPIDYVDAELVDTLSYNDLTDKPIVIGDLDTITPVANTYYKHNGASETTYTKGVIYFYDGSTFAPVTGGSGGGVSDVQINGASIVADGVANIPEASSSQAGVVSTGAQNFQGVKTMRGGINIAETDGTASIQIRSTGKSSGVLWLKGTLLAGKSTTSGERTSYGPSEIYFNKSSNSTVDYAQLISAAFRNTSAGTLHYGNYYFLNNSSGVMMMTPTTWSTGTSGSVTLPSAGLYEVKVTISTTVFTFIVNWDGANITCSMGALNVDGDEMYRIAINASGGVTLQNIVLATATKTSLTDTISYRKIGIA